MNPPSGTARQSRGMAIAQFHGIARVRDGLMGFADDDAVDADPPRQNPLFRAAFRRVRMFPQQPIQQRAGLSFDHISSIVASIRPELLITILLWFSRTNSCFSSTRNASNSESSFAVAALMAKI